MALALLQERPPERYHDHSIGPTGRVLHEKWSEPRATEWLSVFGTRLSALDQVRDLEWLDQGWDSYNAPAPSRTSTQNASRVIAFIEGSDLAALRILPSADGGVALCFIRGDRYADLECSNDGEIFGVRYVGKETPSLLSTDSSDDSIRAALKLIQDHIRG
jgi:hypothetical protein